MPILLDGTALAQQRLPGLHTRATAVRTARGVSPRLLIVAFADAHARVPHVARKLHACADAGVDTVPLVVAHHTPTQDAIAMMHDAVRDSACDGVFVQFPFPAGLDGDELAGAIPAELDVDVMSPACISHFMSTADALPPVTVSAGLLLLDAYDLPVAGRSGVVIAEESPFAAMFREALSRRGALMQPLLVPHARDLETRVTAAELVVVAAAAPALLPATMIAPNAIAIDVGYFNEGGRGDIDVSSGIDHLAAIAPVPGGIGPMTVSALIERVIVFAEERST